MRTPSAQVAAALRASAEDAETSVRSTHTASPPPRQASPPPTAGIARRNSLRFGGRATSPKRGKEPKEKSSPSNERHSKLSLPFFGRKDKKDKKQGKKEAGQALVPPVDENGEGSMTPAVEDDVEAVKQLCSMGFSRTQAVVALEKHQYDMQLALNSLLQT